MRLGPIAGAALLAIGQGRGIVRFGSTVHSFLASLAPWIAFAVVGAGLMLQSNPESVVLKALLVTLVAQLAPPVASYAVAVRWAREEEWLRYATAFNWCQWAIPVVGFAWLVVLQVATGGTISDDQAANLLILGLGLYGLWLHWMIARHGLVLSRWRAAAVVLLVNAATLVLMMAPGVLQRLIS